MIDETCGPRSEVTEAAMEDARPTAEEMSEGAPLTADTTTELIWLAALLTSDETLI